MGRSVTASLCKVKCLFSRRRPKTTSSSSDISSEFDIEVRAKANDSLDALCAESGTNQGSKSRGPRHLPSEGYASHSLLPRGSCHAGDAEEVAIRDGTNSTSQEVCHIMDGRVMIPPREHTTASLIVYGRSCVSNVSKRVSLSACVVHVSVNRDIKLYPETSAGG